MTFIVSKIAFKNSINLLIFVFGHLISWQISHWALRFKWKLFSWVAIYFCNSQAVFRDPKKYSLLYIANCIYRLDAQKSDTVLIIPRSVRGHQATYGAQELPDYIVLGIKFIAFYSQVRHTWLLLYPTGSFGGF